MASTTTTAATEILAPGMLLEGKYEIAREIGAGGMGRIFLATQRPFHRKLVIKVMFPEHSSNVVLQKRFYQEAQAVVQLSHPNTVTVFDFGKTADGLLFIAMEYVEGISLGHLIRESGALPLEDAVAFTVQIAQALGEAHYKGIIHRDLKPDNIMVVQSPDSNSFVKVLDFGIAKLTDTDQSVTQTGSIVGTPAYMAPEQARSKPVDQRSDLYALGCCLFEMLTGAPPFQRDSAVATLLAHQNEAIPSLPEYYNPCLNAFFQRALAKDPEGRPRNAADFVAALLATFGAPPDQAQRSYTPVPLQDRLRLLSARTPTPIRSPSSVDQSREDVQVKTISGNGLPGLPQPGNPVQRRMSSTGKNSGLSLPKPPSINKTIPSPLPFRSDQEGAGKQEAAPEKGPNSSGTGIQTNPTRQVSSQELESHRAKERLGSADTSPSGSAQLRERAAESHNLEPDLVSRGNEGIPSSQVSAPGNEVSPRTSTDSSAPPQKVEKTKGLLIALVISSVVAIGALLALFLSNEESEPTPARVAALEDDKEVRTVSLESAPPGATVLIDDIPVGQTPLTRDLEIERSYSIRFQRLGFEEIHFQSFSPQRRGDNRLFATLVAQTLSLQVSSEVAGSELLVNGIVMGRIGSNEGTFSLRWPEEDLEVTLSHPEEGVALRRIPKTGLQEELSVHFPADLFAP